MHGFINDLARSVGTFLFGRRLCEVILAWENWPGLEQEPPEIQLFIVPVVVGTGLRFLPERTPLTLDLVEERSFASGVVFLRYSVS